MESRPVKYPLGSLSLIEAKTFGEPGQRTFHLAIEAGRATGTVWLEKEQLLQLGIYLRDTVESLPEEDESRSSYPREPEWPGGDTHIAFKAAQLLLSHDEPTNSFYVLAYEGEDSESGDEGSSVSFWITTDQAARPGRRVTPYLRGGPAPLRTLWLRHQPGRPRMPSSQWPRRL